MITLCVVDETCEMLACHTDDDIAPQLRDKSDTMLLLSDQDIPGASLNGKDPTNLNIPQLKRWLACRGAPESGKKPELIQRYG